MNKKNVGTVDRVLRIAAAVVIAILYFAGLISGTLAIVLGIVAVVLLVTGLLAWCPAYSLLGLSTFKKADAAG